MIGKQKILIVDDDEISLNLYHYILRKNVLTRRSYTTARMRWLLLTHISLI